MGVAHKGVVSVEEKDIGSVRRWKNIIKFVQNFNFVTMGCGYFILIVMFPIYFKVPLVTGMNNASLSPIVFLKRRKLYKATQSTSSCNVRGYYNVSFTISPTK